MRKKDEFERITALVREAARSSSLAQDQLQDAIQKFEALYQSSSLGMMLVVDGKIQDVNTATLSMLAYRKEQLVGQAFETIWDNQCSKLQLETLCHHLHQEQQQLEAALLTGDGRHVPCGIEGRLIQQQGRSALMLSITDMRTQKEQAKLIEDLAGKDAQSGLLNRPTVMQLIEEQSAAAPQQFAILYFSIERLKQVASVYGYPAFDAAIQYLAVLFTEQFQNATIGRLSESEFVILLKPGTELNKKLKKANRLIDQLRSPVETDGYQLHLSLKAAFIEPELTRYSLEHLLQAAYYATHASSQQSNHHISTIDECAAEQARIALIISRDLNTAIRQKEIQPHYQPIVAAQSGKIIGFEALARWNHPTLGPVSPAVFIPLA
ncbi:EAL domain-containing protein [Photobacterium sp. TY1-4]|uniref:EAL domain-containing protein n=1 Tax=Photobacterium sp. TY1-4 TaxID=2899122 RepID=UPI0021C0D3C9|nr:EAL domain-containing protein [Photobacterium sp. TY1-4]UXI02435.1 EAL domain-containing protein [Photobacterium sp. TY1-4]